MLFPQQQCGYLHTVLPGLAEKCDLQELCPFVALVPLQWGQNAGKIRQLVGKESSTSFKLCKAESLLQPQIRCLPLAFL